MTMLANKAGFLLLLLLSLLLFEAHGDDALAEANQDSLKTHEKMFKETVKVDLKKIGDEFDKLSPDQVREFLGTLRCNPRILQSTNGESI